MPFEGILKKLVNQVDDALGAIFIDWEGETVMHTLEGRGADPDEVFNLRVMGAHYGILLDLMQQGCEVTGQGEIEGCETVTENGVFLAGRANSDYALVLHLNAGSRLTQARRAFAVAVEEMRRALDE